MSLSKAVWLFVLFAAVVLGGFFLLSGCRGCASNGATIGCSAADQGIITSDSQAAVEALVAGDLAQYQTLLLGLDAKVSRGCRAVLNQSQPARVKCSSAEKKIVISSYQQMMTAFYNLDILGMLRLSQNLENSLTPACWIAVNYPQDASVQQACSVSELNFVASKAGPVMRATERFMTTLDATEAMTIAQDMSAKLTPNCNSALARIRQPPDGGGGGGGMPAPANVYDHGGGTYSVSGVGACTPSDCRAF